MKKIVILLNICIASASVFGMNIPSNRELNSTKRVSQHLIKKKDSSTLEKSSLRHLSILNKRCLKLSMQNRILKQENLVLTQLIQNQSVGNMDVDQLRPSDIEKLEQKVIILSDRVQDDKHLKIDQQKQIEDLKSKLEEANLDLDVTKLNLEAKRRELDETKRKLDEFIRQFKSAKFEQNRGHTSGNFNIFFN